VVCGRDGDDFPLLARGGEPRSLSALELGLPLPPLLDLVNELSSPVVSNSRPSRNPQAHRGACDWTQLTHFLFLQMPHSPSPPRDPVAGRRDSLRSPLSDSFTFNWYVSF
jgi:hypothetical protein